MSDQRPPAQRLPGRRIIVTGASSGVGLQAAVRLHVEGATLVLMARGEDEQSG